MAMSKPLKEKKKQVQPKRHAGKSKAVVKARREKIIKAIAAGKTQQEAGVEAGLSPKSARQQVGEILSEPCVKKSFLELLHEAVPNDMQTNKYRELLGATKVISANVIAPNGEGMADAHSMTKDFIEVPDFAVQLKANDSISKLKGLVVDKSQHGLTAESVELLIAALPKEIQATVRSKILEMGDK